MLHKTMTIHDFCSWKLLIHQPVSGTFRSTCIKFWSVNSNHLYGNNASCENEKRRDKETLGSFCTDFSLTQERTTNVCFRLEGVPTRLHKQRSRNSAGTN